MPKSKSSARTQQQAGAAAVHTTRTPHPLPDTAAFHSFVPAISLVLQQAGVSPVLLQQVMSRNEQLWQACCSYDGSTKSRSTIATCAGRGCGVIVSGTNTQHFLVALLIRRTLAAANMHSHILSFLKGQQKVTEDVIDCCFLLVILVDDAPEELKKSLPKECLLPPAQSADAFAPSHWHPRIIALVLKALMAASSNKASLFTVEGYLSKLRNATVRPLQGGQLVSPTLHAGVSDVLRDQECMDLLWKVFKHPDHTRNAVSVLRVLVAAADPPPGGPGSLSHLLKMGGASPLVRALKHFTQEVEQQQHLKLPAFDPISADKLVRLVACIQKAALHDWLREGAEPDMSSTQGLPPWPENLLEAFLLGAIRAMELDPRTEPDITAPPLVPMDMVKPPPSSYPASARVLSRHPASLCLLVLCIQNSAGNLSMSEHAVQGCSIGFDFIASLLDAADDTAFQKSLPLPELCTCIVKAIAHVREGRVSQSTSAELVRVTAQLLKQLEGLPGVIGIIDSRIPGSCADIMSELGAGVVSEGAVGLAHVSAGRSSSRDVHLTRARSICVSDVRLPPVSIGARDNGAGSVSMAGNVGAGAGAGSKSTAGSIGALAGVGNESRAGAVGAGSMSMAGGSCSMQASGSSEAGSTERAGPKGTASASGASNSRRECAHCGKKGKLKACSRCRAVWYCGSECQRAGWATHRQVCKPQGA